MGFCVFLSFSSNFTIDLQYYDIDQRLCIIHYYYLYFIITCKGV
jgi:hypothetical protein